MASVRVCWEVDQRLKTIMKNILIQCVWYSTEDNGHINYVNGTSRTELVKVADVIIAYGVV